MNKKQVSEILPVVFLNIGISYENNGKPVICLKKKFFKYEDISFILNTVLEKKKLLAEIRFNNELLAISKIQTARIELEKMKQQQKNYFTQKNF